MARKAPLEQFIGMSKLLTLLGFVLLFGAIVACGGGGEAASDSPASSSADSSDEPEKKKGARIEYDERRQVGVGEGDEKPPVWEAPEDDDAPKSEGASLKGPEKDEQEVSEQQQSSEAEEATPTPLPSLRAADNAEGTPLNKAGTVNVTPLPNQIGDCILEPDTDCQGQDLSHSDLSPARSNSWSQGLTADLEGSNFSNMNWTGSNLTSANLEHANFTGANLTGVNFAEAFMWEVNLTNADLTDANLSFADIEDAVLDGTIFCRTTMPDGKENNSGC